MSNKNLGEVVEWTCDVCGRRIRAHTTTVALATLQHRRKHVREGVRRPSGERRRVI